MKRKLSIAAVATLLPALLLYLWKMTYSFSDLAAFWMLCLAGMIFLGNWKIVIDHWQAERGIILRPESWLSRYFTGRIGAFISSALLVMGLVPALTWNALTMSALEAVVIFVLAFVSALLFLFAQAFLARHMIPPFDRIFATGPSAWLVGLPFAGILLVVTWLTTKVPVFMFNASVSEAMTFGMQGLPERRGLIAEVLAFAYAADGAKLWLVAQMREYQLVTFLLNLDMGLFGFLAARASVVITHFVETHYGGVDD